MDIGRGMPFSAAILAGGKSTRMGYDKQLVTYNDQWIMEILKDALLACDAISDLWIVTNKPELYDAGFMNGQRGGILTDEYADFGPMEGLRQGLKYCSEDWLLLVPCDWVTHGERSNLFKSFVDQAAARLKTGEVGVELILWQREGWIQPLPGFYRKSLLESIQHVYDQPDSTAGANGRSLKRLIQTNNTIVLDWLSDADESFKNINTFSELIQQGGKVMKHKKLTDRTEAIEIILEAIEGNGFPKESTKGFLETIKTSDARGRLLAVDLFAPMDLPPRDKSTMDGYAVSFSPEMLDAQEETYSFHCVGDLQMGTACLDAEGATVSLEKKQCAYIPTGGLLPEGARCVVKIEETTQSGNQILIHRNHLKAGQNIIFRGEDCQAGDCVLSKGMVLNAARIGFLALLGYSEVEVLRKPKVVLLTTGDELVGPFDEAGIGQVRDINSLVLTNLIEEAGGEVLAHYWLKDDEAVIEASILQAAEAADLIISSGASSAGKKDCIPRLMEKLGDQGLVLHGLNIKPGKPLGFATIKGTPFVALPGNPVSSFMTFIWVVEPIFKNWQVLKKERHRIRAVLEETALAVEGKETWFSVQLEQREGALPVARIVPGKSGLISMVAQAEGCFFVGVNQTCEPGDEIEVWLF